MRSILAQYSDFSYAVTGLNSSKNMGAIAALVFLSSFSQRPSSVRIRGQGMVGLLLAMSVGCSLSS